MEEPIKSAKDGIVLISEIIKAAGDNPNVKEAGANLGQTALTITKTINNALLPLAAVNFAFDKARKYFAEKFTQDLSVKASSIPPEQVIEPKASIAGPALQGLAFTHEEPNLKDMYLSLLATAMDGRIAAEAHPAFVEIIKQLTSQEARLLEQVLKSEGQTALAEIRKSTSGQPGWTDLYRHLAPLRDNKTNAPVENPRFPAMVDNWVRLGLVQVDYQTHLLPTEGKSNYDWVEERPEYLRLRSAHESETVKVTHADGIMGRTALGIQFTRAVGLADPIHADSFSSPLAEAET
ncbi:MAG: DUF4393 domain-containing protein [Betaproteobacteria bacterium]|nr:DUF4393 domain-containing protein [Betaproteobacteria bacterium]